MHAAIQDLERIFRLWQDRLSQLSEDQMSRRDQPGNRSIKDILTHLWAWQVLSVNRLDAGLHNRQPAPPLWPVEIHSEEDVDPLNAWIMQTYSDLLLPEVIQRWRLNYQQLLDLAGEFTPQQLDDPQRVPWMNGYSLADVLRGSYEHHREHLEGLIL